MVGLCQEIVFQEALSAGSYHPDWFAALLPDLHAELVEHAPRESRGREAASCMHLRLPRPCAARHVQPLAYVQTLDLAVA